MNKTIFQHYKEQFEATKKRIPDIIQKTFESLSDDIVDLQQVRLKDKGEYTDGFLMQTNRGKQANRAYSPNNKQKSGRKTVDLYDTGAFYDSMKVVAQSMELDFSADFMKTDGHISDNFRQQRRNANEFVQTVLGLTVADWEFLKPFFVEKFIELFTIEFNTLAK